MCEGSNPRVGDGTRTHPSRSTVNQRRPAVTLSTPGRGCPWRGRIPRQGPRNGQFLVGPERGEKGRPSPRSITCPQREGYCPTTGPRVRRPNPTPPAPKQRLSTVRRRRDVVGQNRASPGIWSRRGPSWRSQGSGQENWGEWRQLRSGTDSRTPLSSDSRVPHGCRRSGGRWPRHRGDPSGPPPRASPGINSLLPAPAQRPARALRPTGGLSLRAVESRRCSPGRTRPGHRSPDAAQSRRRISRTVQDPRGCPEQWHTLNCQSRSRPGPGPGKI